jgi:serine phosphatase RsbU (regulator of sigma subunit)
MRPPPIPIDEPQRLADLAQLDILYTPPEAAFDRIANQLARTFDAPVAAISFLDRQQSSYKALVGPPEMGKSGDVGPREAAICSHVVGRNDVLVVEDLAKHPDFVDHPGVTEQGFRFYAGAPLRSDSGRAMGTLCIMDRRPRHMSNTEIGLLRIIAESVMTEVKLRAANVHLSRRNAQFEHDLAHARALQQFLLPPESVTCAAADGKSGFCVSRLYHPHDHLGGDFIDVQLRDDLSAALLIADVTGHGAVAALTAAMTKAVFARHATKVRTPEQLLTALNTDLFHASPQDQFVTAVAAIIEPHGCQVRLSSAGHPPPILIRERTATTLSPEGDIPLLIEPDLHYERHTTLSISPMERLLLYSDGASEAVNRAGVPLDSEGLCRLVSECPADTGVGFLRCLLSAVSRYADGRLRDDVALMLIEPLIAT